MTRAEIIQLLKIVQDAYPNVKLKNPQGTIAAWELAFGDEDTKKVYQATRLHMRKCKFFPTPADIVENLTKGEMLYGEDGLIKRLGPPSIKDTEVPTIEPPKRKISPDCPGSCICPYFESEFCDGTKEEYTICCI